MAIVDLTRPTLGSRQVKAGTPVERSAGVLHCADRPRGYDASMRSVIRPVVRSVVGPVVGIVLVVAVAACTASPGSSTATSPAASPANTAVPSAPAKTPKPSAAHTSAPTEAPSATQPDASQPAATPVGTTQTPWGRILDAVPAQFPVFPDAAAAEPPSGGAVSGAWTSKASVSEVATWYHDALLAANWAKVDDGGALEDGSHVLDVQGDLPECKAQVTVKPAGGSTMIIVLFGAGCVGGGDG
jgi:hypothetical protein